MIPEMEAYSGVKTFRVLRALKTISTVKGLIINLLLQLLSRFLNEAWRYIFTYKYI